MLVGEKYRQYLFQDIVTQSSGGEDKDSLTSTSHSANIQASVKGNIITQSLEKFKTTTTVRSSFDPVFW
jgi:hypothetical protein